MSQIQAIARATVHYVPYKGGAGNLLILFRKCPFIFLLPFQNI